MRGRCHKAGVLVACVAWPWKGSGSHGLCCWAKLKYSTIITDACCSFPLLLALPSIVPSAKPSPTVYAPPLWVSHPSSSAEGGAALKACAPALQGCAARLTVLPRLCAFWLAGSAVGHGTWVPLETDRAFVARLGVAFEGTRGMPTQPSIDPRGKPPLPRRKSRSHLCQCLDGDRENAAHPGQVRNTSCGCCWPQALCCDLLLLV